IELNAFGHFAIGRGHGPDALQAHLHFCPDARALGHAHDDRLSLILWTGGEEMLSDMGYVHSGKTHQYFAHSAISHNTVTAFFDNPPTAPTVPDDGRTPADPVKASVTKWSRLRALADARSSLLAYAPGVVSNKAVQLVEASSPGPEWRQISRRTRALLMIAAGEERSYLVDFFHITGGEMHQFVLRPSLDEDVSVAASLRLDARKGTLAGENVPYGQGVSKWRGPWEPLIHDLKSATTDGPFRLAFRGVDSAHELRCFFRGQPGSELIVGQSPSMRRAHNDNRRADTYQGPHVLVRRRGEVGLSSLFGVVHDGWRRGAAPVVDTVTWLRVSGTDADAAVAVSIKIGEREDIVYASTDRQPHTVAGIRFAGRFAVLSRSKGRPAWAWAHDGGQLTVPGAELACAPTVRLPLAAVLRQQANDPVDGFEVQGQIRNPSVLTGQWIRVILGNGQAYGYRIESVEYDGAKTRITINGDPGFELMDDGSRLLYHPFYETTGPCQVEIARSAFRQFHPE
ncbi:MAG: hypothetical protein HN849_10075, partial [Victivallales bacterium]|nr:hypothetical protein [Victivallales bacterium]